MWCIQAVCYEGGSCSLIYPTIDACKARATKLKLPLYGCTLPFEVFEVKPHLFDASIPHAWRADLGQEFMKRYLQSE